MAALYPGQIRTFTNPTAIDYQDVVSHASQHSLANDEVNAIETYLGTGVQGTYSNVRTRLGSVEGTIALMAGTIGTISSLDNATIGTPAITGGTANLITLGSPTIVGGEYTSGTFVNGISIKDKGTITQSGTADHISLVPGASKLVKSSFLRQDITTNTYANNQIIQTGWNYLIGNGTWTRSGTEISFGTAFANAPVIIASFIGYRASSNPTSISDFIVTTETTHSPRTINITAGSFYLEDSVSGAPEADTRVGLAWMAIGSL